MELCVELPTQDTRIKEIAIDAEGRVALTCSDDMTGKLWSLENGREGKLLHTFRVPIGGWEEEDVGEWGLDSCALSPDGKLAVLGGDNGIWIFHTGTGELVRRLDLKGSAEYLAFSGQGRFLATVGSRGLAVFDPATGRQVAHNEDVFNICPHFDWLGEELIVTAHYSSFSTWNPLPLCLHCSTYLC